MKLWVPGSRKTSGGLFGHESGFTLAELMIGSSIGMLVAIGAMSFLYFSGRAASGVTAQTVINARAGNTIEFLQNHIRYATTNFTDTAGNTLTLGFDDDYTKDSSGDGKVYNDVDHYEQFKFNGVNSTNSAACASNSLVYLVYKTTNTTQTPTSTRTLIPTGVRNLPGSKIFSLTNSTIVIIRFGIADSYAGDSYQAIDIQGTGVSLNRLWQTNVMAIIP